MGLDGTLLKDFAQIINEESKTPKQYVRGTIVVKDDEPNVKYVQIDGSLTLTPIAEVVDVQNEDRVLVLIENHRATILGNFTFAPSARKEQEALDKAESAGEISNTAIIKAQEAGSKADDAKIVAEGVSSKVQEAKEQAADAASKAQEANTAASNAIDEANRANQQINALDKEIEGAKSDILEALTDLENQAGEINVIKETYSTKVETETVQAELTSEITRQVGSLQTDIAATYSTKTEHSELEGRLQTQIMQNATNISTQVSKVEKLESDTAGIQDIVDEALSYADEAKSKADAASLAASNAATAAEEAREIANAADALVQSAQEDLDEAKQNLVTVTERVTSTEEEIAEAQAKVDSAQKNVDKALADAESAATAANNAQIKADAAQLMADNAKNIADQAQADLAALTSRVTTAETNISQNAENITLNATRVDEIGTNLEGNYYRKDETDAAISIESGNIQAAVNQNIIDSQLETTEQLSTVINQTASELDILIKEIKSTADDNASSIATLSSTQVNINTEFVEFVQTTTNNLQSLSENKLDASTVSEWARFDGAQLELGTSNSPFKAILTNTELGFWQGDNKIAWISNNELHVLTAVVVSSIQCGNFSFVDEGDLGFSLI